MLEYALAYAEIGWPVFRLSKSKVPLKGTHGHLDATTDETLIRSWWDIPNPPNIGIACGPVVVLDFDGPEAANSPWGASLMAAAAANGGMPATAIVKTRRGVHLYYRAPSGVIVRTKNEARKSSGDPGVDIKAQGGYVVAAGSTSKGFTYSFVDQTPVAELPAWMLQWIDSLGGLSRAQEPAAQMPEHLRGRVGANVSARAKLNQEASLDDLNRIRSALAALPPDGYDIWYQVGMALFSTGWERSDGTSIAFDLFDTWSQQNPEKYSAAAAEDKWRSFAQTARGDISLGTLFHLAKQTGWEMPVTPRPEVIPPEMRMISTPQPLLQTLEDRPKTNGHSHAETPLAPQLFVQKTSTDPLIELNEQFSVIGNIGGKCMALEWINSPADETVKITSFQTFKSISERFAHRYVEVKSEKKTKDGGTETVEELKQLGTYWLKWSHRKTYNSIDLDPTGPEVLPGNVLNIWRGFGVPPKPGSWARMQSHIFEVLASGDAESATYILRWAAWSVQNPGDPAEVALVFRGGKGTGKGTFAHAMRRLFGQHGIYISNSKHMVGQFNGHLRSCILLLADEAFWAGDKQGESTLKGMLTEPVLMIENKGVDASPWRNRLHVIMLANAEWAVPAGPQERRYAVFDVSAKHQQDEKYFDAIRKEMDNGGLEAMLHDLKNLDLGEWHPRKVLQTSALQAQKAHSLDPRWEWLEGLLQDGRIPGANTKSDRAPVSALAHAARDESPKLREFSRVSMGRFLSEIGCLQIHEQHGNSWKFPELKELRATWETRFGAWKWRENIVEWRSR